MIALLDLLLLMLGLLATCFVLVTEGQLFFVNHALHQRHDVSIVRVHLTKASRRVL